MRGSWYASNHRESTRGPGRPADAGPSVAGPTGNGLAASRAALVDARPGSTPRPAARRAPVLLPLLAVHVIWTAGCAQHGAEGRGAETVQPSRPALVAGAAPTVAEQTTVPTAGARCTSEGCVCRGPGEDQAEEKSPPGPGSKRFELRLSAAGARASLEITGFGTIAVSGAAQKCVYVDMPTGGTEEMRLVALESTKGGGVSPVLAIAEYGPKGPYWYDVLAVRCSGPSGDDPDARCDRPSADAWGARAHQSKRGRLDPCGSAVIRGLAWETSGGQAERDGGLFRDFTVRFTMEIKKFATQFAPGSTECVPK
jgi:hypothetical protein